jgi:cell division protein ZapA (FtsZ GTPase activity inhibitor)
VLVIGGQRLRLNANAEPQHLAQLAQLVNERFDAIQAATKNNIPATLLALAALDLADELQSARRKLEEAREEARRAIAAAEARTHEVEQLARQAIKEAIAAIDDSLERDDELGGRTQRDDESETA